MRLLSLLFALIAGLTICKAQPKVDITSRVQVVDTAFYMPQLNRVRAIHILLPKLYEQQLNQRYPVIYLQDGQNMFDAKRSFSGEWAADEAMDSLSARGVGEAILVFIDHGNQFRLSEYLTADHAKYGKAEGERYVQFLVQTLKPYIDRRYRTIATPNGTGIAGSSLGGLISFYAAWQYPEVFGFAGVFSPSFWIAPQTVGWVNAQKKHPKTYLYFYAGGKESETMVADLLAVAAVASKKTKQPLQIKLNGEAQHNEMAWRTVFPDFLAWFIQSHKSALQLK